MFGIIIHTTYMNVLCHIVWLCKDILMGKMLGIIIQCVQMIHNIQGIVFEVYILNIV